MVDHCALEWEADTAHYSDTDQDSGTDSETDTVYTVWTDRSWLDCYLVTTDTWTTDSGAFWVSGYASGGDAGCTHPGEGFLLKFDGDAWTPVTFPGGSVPSAGTCLCERPDETILVWDAMMEWVLVDGQAPEEMQVPEALVGDNYKSDAYCDENGDVCLVGRGGFILRYRDGEWTSMASGVTGQLWKMVHGTEKTLVYGEANILLQLVNDEWAPIEVDDAYAINGLWVSAADEMYMASGNVDASIPWQILQNVDGQWTPLITRDGVTFYHITGDNAQTLYAISQTGKSSAYTIWKNAGDGWIPERGMTGAASPTSVVCLGPDNCHVNRSDFSTIRL